MPKLTIQKPYRGMDDFAGRENAHLLQDCVLDLAQSIKKRPGLKKKFDLTTLSANYVDYPVDGQYWFQEEKLLLVVCNGDLIAYSDANGTASIIGVGLFEKRVRATFTKCTDVNNNLLPTVFAANSGNIVKVVGGVASVVTGANIPNTVTHVASVNTYLLTNTLAAKTTWLSSDVGAPTVWATAEDYTAQAKTDNIQGLFDNKGLVWVFGKDSIEPFYNADGDKPFMRIDSGLITSGIINPYAYTILNNSIYALNSNRDFIRIDPGAYTPTVISDPYAGRIQALSALSDVEVDYIATKLGKKYVLYNFNDAKTSIVYDPQLDIFYEWSYYNTETASREQFRGRCYTYVPDWNVHLIGDRKTGIVYEIDETYAYDNTESLFTEVITGVYDFGEPHKQKGFKKVYFDFRRGDGLVTDIYTSPKVYIQYRLDGARDWGIQHEVDLGSIGQTNQADPVFFNLSFNTIQFRIMHQDASNFVLNGVYYEG